MNRSAALRWTFICVVLLLLGVSIVAYRSLVRFEKEHQVIRGGHISARMMEAALFSIKEAELTLREAVRTGNVAGLHSLEGPRSAIRRNVRWTSVIATDRGQVLRLDSLLTSVDTTLERAIAFSNAGDPVSDTALHRTVQRALEGLLVARAIHGRIARAEYHDIEQGTQEEGRRVFITPALLLGSTVVALLAVCWLFVRALRALAKAERAEQEIARRVVELDEQVRTREFAERSLKHVLDSSVSAIMAFRAVRNDEAILDLEWTLVNHRAEQMLGRSAHDLVGARLLQVLPGTGQSGLFQRFVEVVATGRALRLDNVHDVNGLGLHLDIQAVRLEDGLVVTYTDVGDRERQRTILQESERLALTGKIARTIAHEVRNPLTNVLLALDQIKEETGEAAIQPYTEIVQRNVQRIAQLITQMLESSKPRSSRPQQVEVHVVLEETANLVRDRLELQRMRLDLRVSPDLPTILIDSDELRTALVNIMVNAVEAMEPDRGHLQVIGTNHRGHVRVEIKDNGKGMTEEGLARLFDPFYTGRPDGMGLGLTTARAILNSYGVHLEVASQPAKGTTFVLLFPMGTPLPMEEVGA